MVFINRLLDEREVTEDGKPIGLHPANDLNNHYTPMDFIQMVEKIEKEHNAARLIAMPTDQTYNKYMVEVLPDFDSYVQELRKILLNILIGLAKSLKLVNRQSLSQYQ
ncbi:hypothetical protein IPF89_02405 [Candidatus Saccharibacteria bacterium]|nr:MAG: hypothetical protein IPF89_02405 [Candidatus Saccharibacteria bacterium]